MKPYFEDDWLTVYLGDSRKVLAEMPDESVNCVVTSPPYWGLRHYGVDGQLGLEATPEHYVAAMVQVFREVRRVLRADGTVWLNLGDTYNNADKWGGGGSNTGKHTREPDGDPASWKAVRRRWDSIPGIKPKDLVGIPWMVAFGLRADGWYLRSDIIWSKPNPMPESVLDRPTKAHEYLFLLSRSPRYHYDHEAVRIQPSLVRREPPERTVTDATVQHLIGGGATADLIEYARKHRTTDKQRGHGRRHDGFNDRWDAMEKAEQVAGGANLRSVWTVATQPYPGAHFATFPEALVEPCILAGCPEGGVVLDPFAGSGTTGLVAQRLSRRAVLIDLNADYLTQVMDRNRDIPLGLGA